MAKWNCSKLNFGNGIGEVAQTSGDALMAVFDNRLKFNGSSNPELLKMRGASRRQNIWSLRREARGDACDLSKRGAHYRHK